MIRLRKYSDLAFPVAEVHRFLDLNNEETSPVNLDLYLILDFLCGACLFTTVRKVLLKWFNAPPTPEISNVRWGSLIAKSERKACSLTFKKYFF